MYRSNRRNIEELNARTTGLERSLRLRSDELRSANRELPRTPTYTHANAVTVKDWRGIETVLPMEFCQDVGQMYAILKAVSLKWPYFARHQVQEEIYCLLWEQTGAVWRPSATSKSLVSQSGLVPGATVRLFSLICFDFHGLFGAREVSESDGVKRGCYVCEDCLVGGRHR